MRGVCKTYPGVRAVRDVDFDCQAGEIHGLVGENGSGKSTLLGIASGAVVPDAGTVELLGQPLKVAHPAVARRMGLASVYQDNSLVLELTVAQNLYLAAPEADRPPLSNLTSWAGEKIEEYPLERLDPGDRVAELSTAQRQLVEIVKALMCKPKVLLLDEPTSALGLEQIELLQKVIKDVAAYGTAVVYVSHRLREVLELADRVSVLRDGEHQGTYATANLSEDTIVAMMIGSPVDMEFPPKRGVEPHEDEVLLSAESFSGDNFGPIHLKVHKGEILGLAGAEGNGQREILQALVGAVPSTGSVTLCGEEITHESPQMALGAGIMLLSSDRTGESMFPELSVRHNMTIQVVDSFARRGLIASDKEADAAIGIVERLEIATPSLEKAVRQLSGGNQQKTVLGRTFLYPAKVVAVDEPTQGVDARSRVDIYRALRAKTAEGAALIVKSADAFELAGLCDRVLVISRGKVVRELLGVEITEEGIVGSFITADTRRSKTAGKAPEEARRRATKHFGILTKMLTSDWLPVWVVGLAVLIVGAYASTKASVFLSDTNLRYLMLTALPIACVGMGQMCALLVGGFDISVAAMVSLSICLLSVLAPGGASPVAVVLGVVACIAVGALVGFGNGSFVKAIGVNPFVATIATMSVIQGVALIVRPVYGGSISMDLQDLLTGGIGFVPGAFAVLAALAIGGDLWLHKTGGGLRTRAAGFAEEEARRNGLATTWLHLRGYVLCAVLAAVAGLLLASQIGIGHPTVGNMLLLGAFTSPFLGGASLFGGRGSFVGTLLGALFIATIMNAFTLLHVPSPIGTIISGFMTLVAITLYSGGGSWQRLLASLRDK
jgi:ribose transport system ATP-binding protein